MACRIPLEILESYAFVLKFVDERMDEPLERKQWLQRVVSFAEESQKASENTSPESVSTQNFSNALLFFQNAKIVNVEKGAAGNMVSKLFDQESSLQVRSQLQYWTTLCRSPF